MAPDGPYKSPWCATPHFIVSTVIANTIVYSVVPNGVQAKDGIISPTLREAKQWLKDNGFEHNQGASSATTPN